MIHFDLWDLALQGDWRMREFFLFFDGLPMKVPVPPSSNDYQHVYPVIDLMVEATVREVEADDMKITCHKGCAHCCHLLVEIFWEEGIELAAGLLKLPEKTQINWFKRIQSNAEEFQALCAQDPEWQPYATVFSDDEMELTDELCDAYFKDHARPCAFLVDNVCRVYDTRPSSCRLHMVASDPALCRYEADDDDDYLIPDAVEELGDEVGPINTAAARDGRRGQKCVVLRDVLREVYHIDITQIHEAAVVK